MNLSRTLSSSTGGLIHLTYINLAYNTFVGNMLKEIGNCSKLGHLYLNNNQFSGEILSELGKLSSLESLNICNNMISGAMPEELGNLSSLVEFVAYTNNLTGPLPRSIGNLKNLKTFSAEQNLFGNIPTGVINCSTLAGSFPSGLCKLVNRSAIELDQNKFSGPIPPEIVYCQKLQRLHIANNYFTSELPK
ncbi:hypothetical protein Dsin_029450 [Dipteronia sinensis]|uniref:Disease resistance R13L4/SHOC-2-like LRR domain-containing protein n=1 Tax=Dipteronia sinensis TaxID=43782 RepID=A0AAD9ZSU1_9ROSI|nr:hypothetical protein Dsin_032605 [Dipteronia sinensis]KAK3189889.1 hypothetical protein Dsin_029450 [Dipteronia sinensis]